MNPPNRPRDDPRPGTGPEVFPSPPHPLRISCRVYFWKPMAAYFTALELGVWRRYCPTGSLRSPILDLSCNDGLWGALAAKGLGFPAIQVGLDFNRNALFRLRNWGIHRLGVQGDARVLPFGEGVFSTVVFSKALQEIPEPDRVLREIGRVLRPGGTLVMTCGLKNFSDQLPFPKLFRKFGLEKFSEWYVRRKVVRRMGHRPDIPDSAGWIRMVQEAGLRVEASESFFHPREGTIWEILTLRLFQVFGFLRFIPGDTAGRISATVWEAVLGCVFEKASGEEKKEGGYLFVRAVK